jgi:phosphatidate cytidylyltransferase
MKSQPSNLLVRVITALIGLPLILGLVFRGPPLAFFLLVTPAALIGAFELISMSHPGDRVSQIAGVLSTLGLALAIYFGGASAKVLITCFVALPAWGGFWTLYRLGDPKSAAIRTFSMAIAPVYMLPLVLMSVMRRDQADGPILVLMALTYAWACDTGGYFGGRFFGKHKLYEAVSPKKTVEGAIGGVVAALVGALVIQFTLRPNIGLATHLILAAVAALLGIAGDLAESLIKRSVGVKDSGAIIPGHGGILDRVDALLMTSMTVFLFTLWAR